MPYIRAEIRAELDPKIAALAETIAEHYPWWPDAAGATNYAITSLLLEILPDELHYDALALIIGILETVKLEFYRKMAVPYEDKKCRENGEVYH